MFTSWSLSPSVIVDFEFVVLGDFCLIQVKAGPDVLEGISIVCQKCVEQNRAVPLLKRSAISSRPRPALIDDYSCTISNFLILEPDLTAEITSVCWSTAWTEECPVSNWNRGMGSVSCLTDWKPLKECSEQTLSASPKYSVKTDRPPSWLPAHNGPWGRSPGYKWQITVSCEAHALVLQSAWQIQNVPEQVSPDYCYLDGLVQSFKSVIN